MQKMSVPLSPTSLAERWRRKKAAAAASEAASELTSRAASVLPFRESLPRLALELDRARRYEVPLALAAVRARPGQLGRRLMLAADTGVDVDPDDDVPPEVRELAAVLLSPLLRGGVRVTDLVAYDAREDDHVILFTETTKQQAGKAVRRLHRITNRRFSVGLDSGIAAFPSEGLILDDLVEKARDQRTPTGGGADAPPVERSVER